MISDFEMHFRYDTKNTIHKNINLTLLKQKICLCENHCLESKSN